MMCAADSPPDRRLRARAPRVVILGLRCTSAALAVGLGTLGYRCSAAAAVVVRNDGTAAITTGPLSVDPRHPLYFRDASNRPVYIAGAHTWNNLQEIGGDDPPRTFDYDGYLDALQEQQLNFMRLWRWEVMRFVEPASKRLIFCASQPWLRTGAQPAMDGKPQFDLEQLDEDHFARMRSRIIAAGEKGIYVAVMLFEGWAVQFASDSWLYHPFHSANNVNGIEGDVNRDGKGLEYFTLTQPAVTRLQEAYVRKVVDTVNDLDNVLYEISNENHPGSHAWEDHFVGFIRAYEKSKPKQHPVGLTSNGGGASDDTQRLFDSAADWISPNALKFDYKDDPPAATGGKVIIADSDHLWGVGGTEAWVWKSFLRGLNPVFMDPHDGDILSTEGKGEQWQSIRRAIGQTARLAARVDLASMQAHPKLASTGYCLANPGAEYLIYLPLPSPPPESAGMIQKAKHAIKSLETYFARDTTIDLSSSSGDFAVEWFDPETGETIPSPPVKGGATVELTAPFTGAAVVHLRHQATTRSSRNLDHGEEFILSGGGAKPQPKS